MSCSNAILVRYKVRFQNEGKAKDSFGLGTGLLPVKGVTRLTGLSLGEEGEVTLREQDKVVRIPNNVTTYKDIGMTVRMDADAYGLATFDFFTDWWAERRGWTRTILIDFCNRAWFPLFTIEAVGCSIKMFNFDEQNLAEGKFLIFDLSFTPYETNLKHVLSGVL